MALFGKAPQLPENLSGLPPTGPRGYPRGLSAPGCQLPAALPARAQEVADHVLAEAVRQRPEHPAAVPPGHLVDERTQPLVVGEHEDVQRRAAPGHLVYLGHRELEGFRRRRPVEPRTAVPDR